MMNIVPQVKTNLRGRHVIVSDEWLEACIQWLRSEFPNETTNFQNARWVSDKAFDQYLFTDLTELAEGYIPTSFRDSRNSTLNKDGIVQIISMREIGLPSYNQLQTIMKSDISNSLVDGDKPKQQSWEPKASRMLMLSVTDGVSELQAIEYRPLPQLSVNTKPGAKLLVRTGVNVRRGVLLLTASHCHLLGGGVDSLTITNAPQNVIHRALDLPETDCPIETPVPPSAVQPSQSTQQSQYYPTQTQSQRQTQHRGNTQYYPGNVPLMNNNANTHRTSTPSINNSQLNHSLAAELMAFENDDTMLDDLESMAAEAENRLMSQSAQGNNASNSGQRNNTSNSALRNNASNFAQRNNTSNFAQRNNTSNSAQRNNTSNFALRNNTSNFAQRNSTSNSAQQSGTSNTNQTVDAMRDEFLEGEDEDWGDFDIPEDEIKSIVSSVEQSVGNRNQNKNNSNTSFVKPTQPFLYNKNNRSKTINSSINNTSPASKNVGPASKIAATLQNKSLTMKSSGSSSVNSSSLLKAFNNTPTLSQMTTQNPLSTTNNSFNSSLFTKSLDASSQSKETQNKFQSKITSTEKLTSTKRLSENDDFDSFMKPASKAARIDKASESVKKTNILDVVKNKPPFTYLSLLPKSVHSDEEYLIKGFIMTLVSKLDPSSGAWRLSAKINDGSASFLVEISNEVLEPLIGLSVAEMRKKNSQAASDPSVKSFISKSISRCQMKLISLCCLLTVRLSPDKIPSVRALTEVSDSSSCQLLNRQL